MDIFNVLLQPFIWAIDDVLLSPNLEIDGIDVWTIILAFNITGFTIYGILRNLGSISLPAPEEEPPNETVYYTSTRRVGYEHYGNKKVPVYEHKRYREYD